MVNMRIVDLCLSFPTSYSLLNLDAPRKSYAYISESDLIWCVNEKSLAPIDNCMDRA